MIIHSLYELGVFDGFVMIIEKFVFISTRSRWGRAFPLVAHVMGDSTHARPSATAVSVGSLQSPTGAKAEYGMRGQEGIGDDLWPSDPLLFRFLVER